MEYVKNVPKIQETSLQTAEYLKQKHRLYWCISRQRVWGVVIPKHSENEAPFKQSPRGNTVFCPALWVFEQ